MFWHCKIRFRATCSKGCNFWFPTAGSPAGNHVFLSDFGAELVAQVFSSSKRCPAMPVRNESAWKTANPLKATLRLWALQETPTMLPTGRELCMRGRFDSMADAYWFDAFISNPPPGILGGFLLGCPLNQPPKRDTPQSTSLNLALTFTAR